MKVEGGRGKMCVVFLHEMVLRIEREREREGSDLCVSVSVSATDLTSLRESNERSRAAL